MHGSSRLPYDQQWSEVRGFSGRTDLAKAIGAMSMVVYCDSQVVTSQVNGDYECKGERIKWYLEQVRKRVDKLQAKFVQIPKEENEQANRLAKKASAEHMLTLGKVLSFI